MANDINEYLMTKEESLAKIRALANEDSLGKIKALAALAKEENLMKDSKKTDKPSHSNGSESKEKPVDRRPVAVQLRMYEWEALLRLKGITKITRERMESQIRG